MVRSGGQHRKAHRGRAGPDRRAGDRPRDRRGHLGRLRPRRERPATHGPARVRTRAAWRGGTPARAAAVPAARDAATEEQPGGPGRLVPVGLTVPYRDEGLSGEMFLMAFAHTAAGARFTMVWQTHSLHD